MSLGRFAIFSETRVLFGAHETPTQWHLFFISIIVTTTTIATATTTTVATSQNYAERSGNASRSNGTLLLPGYSRSQCTRPAAGYGYGCAME
jgi:hypothetical protein